MKRFMQRSLITALGLANVAWTSPVANLSANNFEDFVSTHGVTMVKFFAPWCGVCSGLAPIYEDTAAQLDPAKDIRFARVDCVESPDICLHYKTPIYPTLRLFKDPEDQVIYNGVRTPEEMTAFAEVRYRAPVAHVAANEMETFKTTDKVTVLAYMDANDQASNLTYTRVAEDNLDYFTFGVVTSPAAAEARGITRPGLVLHKKFDEGQVTYKGAFEHDSIDEFIETASIPLIGELEQKYLYRYVGKSNPPIIGIFAPTSRSGNTIAAQLHPLAQKHRKTLRFARIDPAQFADQAKTFRLTDKNIPSIALKQSDGRIFHPGPGVGLSARAVEKWLDEYLGGGLTPLPSEEEVPQGDTPPAAEKENSTEADGESAVVDVTEENFQALVLDTPATVLVEFYAPWCGHCKKLAPTYEKLAVKYREDDGVVVAKVDATAHMIPDLPIAGFPTILIFPVGEKSAGAAVKYTGDRSLGDLDAFVRKYSASGEGSGEEGSGGENRGETCGDAAGNMHVGLKEEL